MDRTDLIRAYWEQHRLSTSSIREDRLRAGDWFWAWEEVERSTLDGDEDAVQLLVELAEAASGEEALAYLGAARSRI